MRGAIIVMSLIYLVACGRHKTGEPEADLTDSLGFQNSWEAYLDDSTGNVLLKQNGDPMPDTISAATLIDMMNKRYPEVVIHWVRQSGDTAYVNIPDSHYLTQQMGSTGPDLYFGEAVFNLTEIPGIRYVHFDLAQGDHAGPGTFNRDSFANP